MRKACSLRWSAIEIAWSAITYVLQKDSLPDFVASLLLKILGVGFFFIVLQPQYGPVWIGDIISSFSQAGSAIGGQVQLTPSDPSSVFNCGTDIANAMLAEHLGKSGHDARQSLADDRDRS